MIAFKHASLFDVGATVIAHQANCMNVMGAGVALQIANRWPEVEKDEYNTISGGMKFGSCHISKPLNANPTPFIVHLYGQLGYGTGKRQTSYDALRKAIQEMKEAFMNIASGKETSEDHTWGSSPHLRGDWDEVAVLAESNGPIHIAIPAKIGCGLAGGDWSIVKEMLISEFEKDPLFRLTVCSIDGDF